MKLPLPFLLLSTLALPAIAHPDPLPYFPSEFMAADAMSGNWGGVRTNLDENYGLTINVVYIGEGFGNLSGGLERGAAYDGLLDMGFEVDLAKLTHDSWKGATFFVNALVPHGQSPTAKYVGDIFSVSNIDAPHSTRLYELWLEQTVGFISIRAGQLTADSEFAISDVGSLFLNGTLGWPAGISANANAPAYPVAGLGVRIRADLNEQTSFAAGFYDGDPSDFDAAGVSRNPNGIHWELNSQQGMFAIFEFTHKHETGSGPIPELLPGYFKVGTWFHTGQFPDNTTGKIHSSNVGCYAIADQTLWFEDKDSGQGLSAFGRFCFAPQDKNFFQYYCDCGLVYTGLIPCRDGDQCGAAFAYGEIAPPISNGQRAAGGPVQTDTAVFEFTYHAQLTPWFAVQPDLQYVIQPDGASTSTGGIADAVVAGVRFECIF